MFTVDGLRSLGLLICSRLPVTRTMFFTRYPVPVAFTHTTPALCSVLPTARSTAYLHRDYYTHLHTTVTTFTHTTLRWWLPLFRSLHAPFTHALPLHRTLCLPCTPLRVHHHTTHGVLTFTGSLRVPRLRDLTCHYHTPTAPPHGLPGSHTLPPTILLRLFTCLRLRFPVGLRGCSSTHGSLDVTLICTLLC